MKTTKIAVIGAASILAMVALLLAYPAMAATNLSLTGAQPLSGTTLASSSSGTNLASASATLTVGQTVTLTSTNGKFAVVGTPSQTGTAAGTVVLSVTGAFKGGYSLSIASGTVTIGGSS